MNPFFCEFTCVQQPLCARLPHFSRLAKLQIESYRGHTNLDEPVTLPHAKQVVLEATCLNNIPLKLDIPQAHELILKLTIPHCDAPIHVIHAPNLKQASEIRDVDPLGPFLILFYIFRS